MRVALISMNSEMGDPDANLKKIADWMQEAHSKGARLLSLMKNL